MKQKMTKAVTAFAIAVQALAALALDADESSLVEIQQAMRTHTNDHATVRAVGLKYKDASDPIVSRSAHAALIRANDFSQFTNVLVCFRESLISESGERDKYNSLMSLYVRQAHSPTVDSVLKTEIATLDCDNRDEANATYCRALTAIVLDISPDLVPDSWLHKETDTILLAATNRSVFVHNQSLIDSMSRALASRGDPATPDVVARLRQVGGADIEPYCKRYISMYQVTTASHPEEILRTAMTAGDDILERWCIRVIHEKGISSMLPFAEQRSRETTGLTKDFYLHLIRDMKNPDQIKGPIGSYDNPVYISEPLMKPSVGDDIQQNEIGKRGGPIK